MSKMDQLRAMREARFEAVTQAKASRTTSEGVADNAVTNNEASRTSKQERQRRYREAHKAKLQAEDKERKRKSRVTKIT